MQTKCSSTKHPTQIGFVMYAAQVNLSIPASPALVVELHGACLVVFKLINVHLSIPFQSGMVTFFNPLIWMTLDSFSMLGTMENHALVLKDRSLRQRAMYLLSPYPPCAPVTQSKLSALWVSLPTISSGAIVLMMVGS